MRLPFWLYGRVEASPPPSTDVHAHCVEALAREQARYDILLGLYHDLRLKGANAKEPVPVVPAPKQPPGPIMRAIRIISPRDDAAYFANLKLYRDNEEDADSDPDAFAERIKRGRLEGEPVTVAD